MKSNFRQVYVYVCDIETTKQAARLPSMNSIVDVLERHWRAGTAKMKISNDTALLAIGDVVRDAANDCATILVRHSDLNAAETVYSDLDADTFTSHAKGATEGGETGVHVLISTSSEAGMPDRYAWVVEKAPNLQKTLIRRLFNRILRNEHTINASTFAYPSPVGQRDRNGNVVNETCLPRLELSGLPSATFATDVNNGKLSGVTLVKAIAHTPVGGVAFLQKDEASLKLVVDHNNVPNNAFDGIRRALRHEAINYPQAKITFGLPGRKRSVTVKVESATGNPLDDLYVRSFDLNKIFPPLAYSSRSVVPHLEAPMKAILLRERT